ncbi:MAG TPA: hypothetical protein VIK91_21975 [Nannocystis sp.]
MIYVQVGLYAEGRSDYELLLPLIERLLPEVMAQRSETYADLPEPIGIDAPGLAGKGRAGRIAAAIEHYWERCTLFVIHADADRQDATTARVDRILPGVEEARRRIGKEIPFAACVPVRMLEAWMLSDANVFRELCPTETPRLPQDPEKVLYPKQKLENVLRELRRRPRLDMYGFWGKNLDFASLRRLPAFQAFERELSAALDLLARG